MNLGAVEQIAKAVLYEGYMLYPYRPSSVKNQQRFNWGVLSPQAYCELQPGSESSSMQTECLLRADSQARLTVQVGFLQIVQRLIARNAQQEAGKATSGKCIWEFVDRLEVNGRIYQPWQEAVERSNTVSDFEVKIPRSSHMADFSFRPEEEIENLRDSEGRVAGAILRKRNQLEGKIQVSAELCREGIVKVTVRVDNRSSIAADAFGERANRDTMLPHAFVSTHIILGVENGTFLSLLEPPPEYGDLTTQCENRGVWPVLASDDATAMLASPIILYDHPAIAAESTGNLFDATEIDEILSLRILTLTDAEKDEIRQSDDRARELLERTENIPDEQFMKLHGVLRGLSAGEEAER